MTDDNKMLDKFSKLIGDGLASIGHIKSEMEVFIKNKIELYIKKMDLVQAKDFDDLQKTVAKMSTELEKLKKEVAAHNLKHNH